MALNTNLKKFAVMDWCNVSDPGIPVGTVAIDQQDQQILIWGNPDVLWGSAVIVAKTAFRGFIGKNTNRMGLR